MKKAIGYVRISTKDQSNFSLEGQDEFISQYCSKNNLELITIFKDDGESAKNFDRPNWKALELFIKRNHSQVDQLVICKYDRFSRNLGEALKKIELFETKYKILIVSAMEPIGLHPQNPYYTKMRTDFINNAQTELLIIRDRTKFGIHHAAKQGRVVNNAPFGYKNARDEKNKPIIQIVPEKAEAIKTLFRKFINGDSIAQLKKAAPLLGYKKTGKSAITRMLSNPVYAGMVKVNAYYDEQEQLVKGIHEGIISENDWWKVQTLLKPEKPRSRYVLNENVPLRGILLCHTCGKVLTAGNSKGKKLYYWYYCCLTCKNANISAIKIHAQLIEILQTFSLPQSYIDYLKRKVIDTLEGEVKSAKSKYQKSITELADINLKKDNLEEKFIGGDIDKETYIKWKRRYDLDRDEQLAIQKETKIPIDRRWAIFENLIGYLTDITALYNLATLDQKQSILRWVFDSPLSYSDGMYRTLSLRSLFASKAALLKEKRLLMIEKSSENLFEIEPSTQNAPSIEHIYSLLHIISDIKIA